VKRFHQEARAVGSIGHPNICEIYDFGTLADGGPYLIMERLQGKTLADRLMAEGPLPIDDVLDAVTQVLSGLTAAHEHGILHRDIKPENVFLVERAGQPTVAKLLDFGVSKVVSARITSDTDVTELTKTGFVMGTPYYVSPEQANGSRDLDERVDIYACGILLYETLTGRRPYYSQNHHALLALILDGKATPPHEVRRSIPAELEGVVMKAMAKDRNARYRTAAELSRALASTRKQRRKASSSHMLAARTMARTPEIPVHFDTSPDPLPEADVPTDRMTQDEIKALTDAIREAREREKRGPR
jgi:serine/threonine-protein kinase